jgi:NitT/TauT family transport system permease protein
MLAMLTPNANVVLQRPAVRSEIDNAVDDVPANLDVERRLGLLERLWGHPGVRRMVILLALAIIWECYATYIDNPLLFPRFSETLVALWDGIFHGPLLERTWSSIRMLLISYGLGILIAGVFVTLAVSSRIGRDLLTTLTAMFNPLPAIALLPLALLWFGLGSGSLVFVIIHSVLWAVALNTLSGFMSVNETLRMSGQNYGLSGVRFVVLLLIPAALPAIITGLKIGWAFAWRTLIAAELVFGATSRSGGLGWYIYENRNQLETPSVFAGLFVVILIGLFVEGAIFRTLESRTVQRWGMQR